MWTSNIVESPHRQLAFADGSIKIHGKINGEIAMIWKLLLVAEFSFRRVMAPVLMAKVADELNYKDGIESQSEGKSIDHN